MADTIHFDVKLLRSEAFRGLGKWGFLVYLDFLKMRKMVKIRNQWIIENNGELVYPYATAERKGISRKKFRAALDELIKKGFLDIAKRGNGGEKGATHKFYLDDRWERFGKSDFKPARNPMEKDSRSGRGWAVVNQRKRVQSSVSKTTPERMAKMTIERAHIQG